jgi:manganese efflux pump family protein
MAVTALITWLLTAVGGFVMLGMWIAKGGVRQPRTTKFPPAVIFGHFALAAAGLVVWIIYLIAGGTTLAWTAFILLIPVALLGFVMLLRWIPTYRAASAARTGGPGTTAAEPPEKSFPVPVVAMHGLFAVATVVLVLITALQM